MKKFMTLLLEETKRFLGQQAPSTQQTEQEADLINQIELSLYKQAAVHIICLDKSVTGKIASFDKEKNRLIIHHLQHNMVSILALRDIQRVRLLPDRLQIKDNS